LQTLDAVLFLGRSKLRALTCVRTATDHQPHAYLQASTNCDRLHIRRNRRNRRQVTAFTSRAVLASTLRRDPMSVKRLSISVILFMALVLPAGAPGALAQPPAPALTKTGNWLPPRAPAGGDYRPEQQWRDWRAEDGPGRDLVQSPDGLWLMPAASSPEEALPAATLEPNGGPDDFGYTFNATTLDWIDASGGIDTGINSSVDSAGPIAIGFPFST
jgi:hypothetical protein